LIPAPPGGKCFVGVDDVGLGHLLAWTRGAPGRHYLLGAENRRYADVILRIARAWGRRPLLVPLPARSPALLRLLPGLSPIAGALEQMTLLRYRSAARARRELGWSPSPVDQSLMAMAREASERA
jgi:dihydroflavonol-4-reductase